MTRNYFSKHGGPYFINDGLSGHCHEEDIKPDKGLFIFIAIGFVTLLVTIGIVLIAL
jgi:hypothetical protein